MVTEKTLSLNEQGASAVSKQQIPEKNVSKQSSYHNMWAPKELADSIELWYFEPSLEDYKKNKFFVPLWDPNQQPLDLRQRKIVVPTIRDVFKLFRDIINDSHNSMKFVFNAKVIAFYSPKLTALVIKHKFDEWRADIKHGQSFYSMLGSLLGAIVEQSKKKVYTKQDINFRRLRKRQILAIDYIENIIRESPVLENLDWRQTKQPNGQNGILEAADVVAQMRIAGMSSAIWLLERCIALTKRVASKEVTQDFTDLAEEEVNASEGQKQAA